MNKQVLQMKYHPAKKAVEFHRFQSGMEITIKPDSKLVKYEKKRGSFVLQDHGNAFFADIVEAFDGENVIDIDVITTNNDYEDFKEMVEYFNKDASVRIDITLLAELPDMETTYRVVKDYGEKSLGVLKKHQTKFFEIDMHNESVKKVAEDFSAEVQKEVNSINEKIDAIVNNEVNLCFAGVYSAGKSALINAILGYAILPENINSETARMFCVQSPKSGEKVRIIFEIQNNYTELVWDETKNIFEFVAGPVESASRKSIQESIHKCENELQYRQIYEILKVLNSNNDISNDITVFYPVPLDNEKIQFKIYDTPGTDSNYGDHQTVLQKSLSKQTHSIVVFVAAPNKTEGEGNNALLNYLKKVEKKDSKTSIDIARSLFVINWADSIGPEERIDLQKAVIKDKDDPSFSIKLSDKKLFFTSAKVAYAAKAKQNGIASKSEEFIIRQQDSTISDPEFGRYYQQNRCATSEYSTSRLIELSSQAFDKAESENDILEVLHICSGVYALEKEIVLYGEKFATAVRAFAIIDSVDKAMSKMNTTALAMEGENQEDIVKVNREIEECKETIRDDIDKAYDEMVLQDNTKLPQEILEELHLDQSYITKVLIEDPHSFFDKLLKRRFFGLGKVEYSDKHKKEITQRITSILSDFTSNFHQKRKVLLERQRDTFIGKVKRIIQENGSLNEKAKDFITQIRPPKVSEVTLADKFGGIYDEHKRVGQILWFEFIEIDKKNFIDDVTTKLNGLVSDLQQDFEDDYRKSLCSVLSAVEAEYKQNLDKYSIVVRAKLDDKAAFEQLGLKIKEAATELRACQDDLNTLIWSVKENDK